MEIRLDLRLRIALALATVCIAVVGALGVTLYTASEDMEKALVDQIVSEEVDYLIKHHRNNPDYHSTPGPNLQHYIIRTPEEAARLPREVRGLPPGNHEIGSGRDERHVAVRRVGDTRFIVIYDVGPHEERKQRFENLLLLSLASVAFIALLLGYWLAGVLTRQLTDLAQKVARLSPDEPHAPLARPGQDAEVAALARALTLSPLAVALIKAASVRHCPWSLQEYGGFALHLSLFDAAPSGLPAGRCFPAGHASTGFCLMAFYFAGRARRQPLLAWAGLATGLVAGSVLGFGRMLQGAHFLTHTLWTGLVCWAVILILYLAVIDLPKNMRTA